MPSNLWWMFDVRKMWLSCVDPGHFATMLVNLPIKLREKNIIETVAIILS